MITNFWGKCKDTTKIKLSVDMIYIFYNTRSVNIDNITWVFSKTCIYLNMSYVMLSTYEISKMSKQMSNNFTEKGEIQFELFQFFFQFIKTLSNKDETKYPFVSSNIPH